MSEPAPLLTALGDIPAGGTAVWLTTNDGVRIRTAHWAPKDAQGTIFLFPGRTEYIEKYGRVVRNLTESGFAVITVDWRGQGLADRLLPDPALGHVGSFADYQRDVTALVAYAATLDLPKPWFLLAHSMGGCIGLRALHQGMPVSAVVFSAPMWDLNKPLRKRPVAFALRHLPISQKRAVQLGAGQSREPATLTFDFDDNLLTTDATIYATLREHLHKAPELGTGGPTYGWLQAALREMAALRALPAPTLPALTWLGSAEKVVLPAAIIRKMRDWRGGKLVTLSGAKHEVMMERPSIRRRVLDDSIAFFHRMRGL